MCKTLNIQIDGVTYAPMQTSGDVRIVILERGWVVVGHYERDGDTCKIKRGAVIRIWGTTKGLPELVNGPIAGKTTLDKCETDIEFNVGAQIATMAVNADKWKAAL